MRETSRAAHQAIASLDLHPLCHAQNIPRGGNGERRRAGDGFGQFKRAFQKGLRFHNPIDEVQRQGFISLHPPSGEDHFAREPRRNSLGQAQQPARIGQHAELRLWQPEARRRAGDN